MAPGLIDETAAPDTGSAKRPGAWERIFTCWPAAAATALFLNLVAVTVRTVKANEGGRFAYPIDDVYLHMAIAKNLLHHGVWGVSYLSGFSWCSSSLNWPPLIALAFAIFGVHEYLPFVMNVAASVAMFFYAGWLVRRTTRSGFLSLLVLVAVVVLTPILAMASTGMEHSLHILLSLIFVDLGVRLLSDDEQRATSASAEVWLCIVGALMTTTRYEGLFLVAPVGLLLLCRRRWALAISLGLVTTAPLIAGGLFAMSKGWYFLPSSLLIKGNVHLVPSLAGVLDYLSKWYEVLVAQPHMFTLGAAVTAAMIGSMHLRRTLWNYPSLFLFITLAATIQHLQFAGIGWFYRYEAYLIVLALIGIGVALGYEPSAVGARYWFSVRAIPHYFILLVAAMLFGAPLWTRARPSMHHIVTASYNVYEQQYQMARFARRYYQNKGAAFNDVGAVDYFADLDLLDTAGLVDIDVFRAARSGNFNAATMRRLLDKHHVELIAVYDEWSASYGGILPEWVLIGQWKVLNNTVLGGDTVSFYAPNIDLAPKLTRALTEFGPNLPKDVIQDGTYRGTHPLSVMGTFPGEGPKDAMTFWTNSSARFCVYPAPEEPLGSDDTTLKLSVCPISKGEVIEVFFNDHLVETQRFSPDETPHWTTFAVKAKWHEGVNTLKLVGHGVTVQPPRDGRTLLFMVLDPRRTMDESGKVVPQPGLAN